MSKGQDNDAGDYRWRFRWEAQSYGEPDTFGGLEDDYAGPAYLWGGYDTDRTSNVITVNSGTKNEVRCSLRFRNYPAVKPLDRITDVTTGEVFFVERVHRGLNEIFAEVSTQRPTR